MLVLIIFCEVIQCAHRYLCLLTQIFINKKNQKTAKTSKLFRHLPQRNVFKNQRRRCIRKLQIYSLYGHEEVIINLKLCLSQIASKIKFCRPNP